MTGKTTTLTQQSGALDNGRLRGYSETRLCQSGRRRFHPHPRIKSGAGSSPLPEGEGIVDSTYQTDTDSSETLGLYVCWEDGMLWFFDPVSERYLRSHEETEARVDEERAGRMAAEARARGEATARERAEARAAELEAELHRLRGA